MIIFAAPGLGKSTLVKERPNEWIDCDSVILAYINSLREFGGNGRIQTISDAAREPHWEYYKTLVMPLYKQIYEPSGLSLVVGKSRYIRDCACVYVHHSSSIMQERIRNNDRDNVIIDYDCEEKHVKYIAEAVKHNKPVVHINYLSEYV